MCAICQLKQTFLKNFINELNELGELILWYAFLLERYYYEKRIHIDLKRNVLLYFNTNTR